MAIAAESLSGTLDLLKPRLASLMPEFEIKLKAELVYEINRKKKERGAIILGHNYMEPALFHGVADVVGDSLQLSREAARANANPIVFCGVKFMAETAKVLNPSKTVLLPSLNAGCSLAASITAEDVRKLKAKYPGIPVVVYINTYADVHAEADSVCTSSNAAQVVASFDSDTIIFLPDEYLARNVAAETGKRIVFPGDTLTSGEKLLIGWKGRCEVHEKFSVDDITRVREQFPDVFVLAHPECTPEVVQAADFSGSTSKMVHKVKETKASKFLILTECSMADNIIAESGSDNILRLCNVRCPHMATITLEDTLAALTLDRYVIDVPEPTATQARRALDRMLMI